MAGSEFDPYALAESVTVEPDWIDDVPSVTTTKTICRDSRRDSLRGLNLAPDDKVSAQRVYLEDILERDGGLCQICLTPIPLDRVGTRGPLAFVVDHIDPVGDHVMANLRAAHNFCNGSKWAKACDVEVDIARARLSQRLRTGQPPRRSSFGSGPQQGDDGSVARWRRLPQWIRRRAVQEPDEVGDAHLAEVRTWAERLPGEVERYLATYFPVSL